MRKIIAVMTVITMCVSAGFAAFSSDDAGTSTAQFLKLGADARAAGMGEAYAGVAAEVDSIYWNPGGLNNVEERSFSFMNAIWFQDISYHWAAYAQRLEEAGVVGIGLQYLYFGKITETDGSGIEQGSFSPSDLAVSLSYAQIVEGVGLGANVKYISSRIKNSASAFGLDLGAQYSVDEKLTFGAAIQNIGTKMKFDLEGESLPLNVKVGGAYDIQPNWKVALDVNAPNDSGMILGAGTEYVKEISEMLMVAGRLGYNTQSQDTGGLHGLSMGLGLMYTDYAMNYSLDYAFVPYGELGNTHRISFGIKF